MILQNITEKLIVSEFLNSNPDNYRIPIYKMLKTALLTDLQTDGIDLKKIMQSCCLICDIPFHVIPKKTRKKEIVLCRQLIYYFVNKYLDLTLSTMAKFVSGQDHCTALHGIKKIENDLFINYKPVVNIVQKIELKLYEK